MSDSPIAQAPAVPPNLLPPKMVVGVNYAWPGNWYGYWIGRDRSNPYFDWTKTMPAILSRFRAVGVKVVRMFLLCNAYNYGKWRKLPFLPAGSTTRVFDQPTMTDPLYIDDFKSLLQMFDKDFQVIPSLVDFHMFWDGNLSSIAKDSAKRKTFFDTVLNDFLEVSKKRPESIYAWEVINEPYWNIHAIKPDKSVWPAELSEAEMKDFLDDALQRIASAGFPSTVGHRHFAELSSLPTGAKRQFHYYPKFMGGDPNFVPTFAESQAFVGEIACDNSHGPQWAELVGISDTDVLTCVYERLKLLACKEYELALLWPNMGQATDVMHFQSEALDGIKQFTSAKFPGGIPICRSPSS